MEKNDILNEFYNKISSEEINLYKELAETAIKLGYMPKKDKQKNLSIAFSKNKVKKTILKFYGGDDNGKGKSAKGTCFKLKFYANKGYSEVFDKSIKKEIEIFNYKYVGCYGCGRCKKDKLGYNIEYEDGRKYFRCGFELIPIETISKDIVNETTKMMEIQDKAFFKELE
ncbi:hypothetical protein FACS1894142_5710 [Spirochaetia bacterium]|nr:hypothetical protein FACS1894142_5710 [Spirochaetia bacterium]